MSLGTVIALPFSGFLAEALGWEYVFYVQGGLGALWLVLWILCVYDSPQEHPFIHPDELELYSSSTSSSGAGKKVDNNGQVVLQLFNNLLCLLKKESTCSVESHIYFRPILGYSDCPHLQQFRLVYASCRATNLYEAHSTFQHWPSKI